MIFDLKLDILYLRDCDDRVEAWPGSGLGWAGLGWAGQEMGSEFNLYIFPPVSWASEQAGGAAAYLVLV